MNLKFYIKVYLLIFLSIQSLHALTLTVNPSRSFIVDANNQNVELAEPYVGTSGSTINNVAAIFFRMPTLANFESFNSIRFNVTVEDKIGLNPGSTIHFGVLKRSSDTPQNGDYSNGPNDFGTTELNLIPNSTTVGTTVATESDQAVNAWVTNNYEAGQYLMVQLIDSPHETKLNARWVFSNAKLVIDYNVVPEVSTSGLILGSLAFGFICIRRGRYNRFLNRKQFIPFSRQS